jgi:hypothetical protein
VDCWSGVYVFLFEHEGAARLIDVSVSVRVRLLGAVGLVALALLGGSKVTLAETIGLDVHGTSTK